MAAFEIIALDPVTPQLRAPGASDQYTFPRPITGTSNIIEMLNGTNAQTFRIYNTFTDASNYERGFMRWSSNVLQIGAEAAGTGTLRKIAIVGNNVGIGTTDPLWQFTVQSSGTAEAKIRTTGTGGANFGFLCSGAENIISGENTAGTGRLKFKTLAGANAILDLESKSVKIGSDNYLNVTDTCSIFDNTTTTGVTTLRIRAGAGQSTTKQFIAVANNNTTELFSVNSDGVAFGTHSTIGAETVTGFITIKDSGGTTRKLAVIS
jgi:hypothetical protein